MNRSCLDREIAALAVPALGTLVADPLLSLVDTAFVGRLGTEALGALGVASALFAFAFFAFNFLEYGTTAVVAKSVGASDLGSAGRATATALATAAVAGSGAALLLLVLAGPAVGLLGGSGEIAVGAIAYVRVRALAAPAVLLVRAAHGAYRGFQDTRTPFFVTLGMNGVNLALDPLLIFGLGWGITGAAWATVAAQWLGAGVFLVLLRRSRGAFGLAGARPRGVEVRSFLSVGRDLAIRTAALLAAFTLASAVAARVSPEAIAAHQVLGQVFLFTALALDALAIAGQALVARYLGSDDAVTARSAADRLLVLGVGFGLIVAVGLLVVGPLVPGWFGADRAVSAAIDATWWVLVALQPVGALVWVWDGVFIGAADFRFLAAAMVGAAAVSAGVLLAVLPLGLGLGGVWAAIAVLLVARAATLWWRRLSPRGPLTEAG